MALPKIYDKTEHQWHNNTTPSINEDELNAISEGLSDIDDRVIELAGTIMEDVPAIIEGLEIIEPAIQTINQSVATATAAASTATTKASEASGSASTASTKAGEASTSASTASTKAGEAAASASTASTKAGEAATSATNAANSATAAATSASRAEAWSAHPPYIGANGNWYVWSTSSNAYVDSGIDASITVTVGTTTTLEAGSDATVTNTGTSTDPILNFGIPQGIQGQTGATPNITMTATADAVSSDNPSVTITKSGTGENPSFALAFSGLKGTTGTTGATPNISASASIDGNVGTPSVQVTKSGTAENPSLAFAFSNLKGTDGTNGTSPEITIATISGGHRVTITDADHPAGQSFDVMDGAGSGDMIAATYDPNGDVATAGGIADYVDDAISGKADTSSLASVATSGSYNDLSNKPTIPAAQVNSDWNASSGVAQILNKPSIPAEQIQSDWNQNTTTAKDYIKNKPTIPTKVSQLTNDSGYTTNTGTITSVKMNGSTISTSGEANLGTVITSHQSLAACYQTGDTAETSLADGDYFPFYDTSASGKKKTLWSNIKSVLKTYFDSLYKGASVHDTWSEVTSKPFTSTGSGLTVSSNVLKASQYDITLNHTGTASATVTRQQNLAATGASGVNTEVAIDGTRYLESSTKTTSSGVDTFSFTNANITTTAVYDFYADKYGVAPSEVSVSTGSMSVKFKSTDSVTKCRVYIK